MTPFQQFRLWGRRAPAGERLAAAVAAALVLAVVGWLVAPPGSHSNSQGVSVGTSGPGSAGPTSLTAGGAGGGAAVGASPSTSLVASASSSGGAGPSSGASTAGAGSAGGASSGSGGSPSSGAAPAAGSAGQQTAEHCVSPPGSDQGVTSTQIKIAIILLNIVGPAANTTFGIESPSAQQAQYQAAINDVNKSGGVACRHLTPIWYTGDALDQSGLQGLCTTIVAAKPFFVIDYGAYYSYPQIATCYPEAQIPFYSSQIVPLKLQQQYYPYLFGKELKEMLYKDAALGLAEKGYLAHIDGLHKLGVLYSDCVKEIPGEAIGYFHQAGVPSTNISQFDVGCNTSFTPPSTIQQAIVQFEQDHVAYVTQINDAGDVANFTTIAAKQQFKPKYLLPDDGIVPIVTGTQKPDPNNFNGAIAITPDRFGEEFTQGSVPSAATRRCDAIMTAAGQPITYKSPDGASGQTCANIWMLAAAIDHAPVLQRNALAAGLQAAGSVDYPFPYGPNSFGKGVNYGGEAWRVDQFSSSCGCFQVIDPTFHPPF